MRAADGGTEPTSSLLSGEFDGRDNADEVLMLTMTHVLF
jgi:hypothetical protein